jgi:hypothetical protein
MDRQEQHDVYIYIMSKRRKQVYLEEHQEAMLKRLAGKRGQPQAILIREALDGFIGSAPVSGPTDQTAWRKEREFILTRMRGKPISKRKKWTRDEIHDRGKMSG